MLWALMESQISKANKGGQFNMARNLVRGILGLVLAAAATWLANMLVERIFGPEEIA